MDTTSANTADTLTSARELYRVAAVRAASAWVLITTLHGMRLHLPRNSTLSTMADSIYFDGKYSAGEDYSSVEEFLSELTFDVDKAWPELSGNGDNAEYVLRPFFNAKQELLSGLRLGYLRTGDFSKLKALAVDVPNFDGFSGDIEGLTLEELTELIKGYRTKVLKIVNLLRDLSCTLNYVKAGVERDLPKALGTAYTLPDGSPIPIIEKLRSLCDLPFLPAPTEFYGSEADRINALASLPGSANELAKKLSV